MLCLYARLFACIWQNAIIIFYSHQLMLYGILWSIYTIIWWNFLRNNGWYTVLITAYYCNWICRSHICCIIRGFVFYLPNYIFLFTGYIDFLYFLLTSVFEQIYAKRSAYQYKYNNPHPPSVNHLTQQSLCPWQLRRRTMRLNAQFFGYFLMRITFYNRHSKHSPISFRQLVYQLMYFLFCQ